MLDAIERLHDKGYIHRDIKPSNFVMGKGKSRNQVFMVDFGLAKVHLGKDGTPPKHLLGVPLEQRPIADFRGTVTYASLNAHNKIVSPIRTCQDLSRRDDLWSLYFVILDFLNEQLPWRNCKENKVDEVRDIKTKCLAHPEEYLWRTTTSNLKEVHNIFHAVNRLQYADRPNYEYIRQQLNLLLQKEEYKEQSLRSLSTNVSSSVGTSSHRRG